MPMATVANPTSSDERAPNTTRASTSRPLPSVPNQCDVDMPSRAPKSLALGSEIGSSGASAAAMTTRSSQPAASHAVRGSRFRVRPIAASSTESGSCSTTGSTATALGVSDMADAGVEPLVQEVYDEVHEHVQNGDDRHHALERHVLAFLDGPENQQPHSRQREDDLHRHRAADQGAHVDADDGEQGQAGGTEGMAPE